MTMDHDPWHIISILYRCWTVAWRRCHPPVQSGPFEMFEMSGVSRASSVTSARAAISSWVSAVKINSLFRASRELSLKIKNCSSYTP